MIFPNIEVDILIFSDGRKKFSHSILKANVPEEKQNFADLGS